jgi:acetyl-CoA synthetase
MNISSPGWAKHAWSCFFAPWNAGACVFLYNYSRFDAKGLLDVLVRYEITTLCAPPTVWRMLIQQDLAASDQPARADRRRRAPQPGGHRAGAQGLGHHDSRRLRPDRDHRADRQLPGQPVKPGSMGRPLPGYTIALLMRRPARERGRSLPGARSQAAGSDARQVEAVQVHHLGPGGGEVAHELGTNLPLSLWA